MRDAVGRSVSVEAKVVITRASHLSGAGLHLFVSRPLFIDDPFSRIRVTADHLRPGPSLAPDFGALCALRGGGTSPESSPRAPHIGESVRECDSALGDHLRQCWHTKDQHDASDFGYTPLELHGELVRRIEGRGKYGGVIQCDDSDEATD